MVVRNRIAKHTSELSRTYLLIVEELRALKPQGDQRAEMQIAAEVFEETMAIHGAFLENMRGRFEARLGLLRRGEPLSNGKAELSPEHGAFWMEFSRLCAALRRAEKISGY
jgi:hypothetical protein